MILNLDFTYYKCHEPKSPEKPNFNEEFIEFGAIISPNSAAI